MRNIPAAIRSRPPPSPARAREKFIPARQASRFNRHNAICGRTGNGAPPSDQGDKLRAETAGAAVSAARQHFAHALDELGLGDGELGALAQLEVIGPVLGRLGELGAELHVADRDPRAAGRAALV
jgi:hypothetical protein